LGEHLLGPIGFVLPADLSLGFNGKVLEAGVGELELGAVWDWIEIKGDVGGYEPGTAESILLNPGENHLLFEIQQACFSADAVRLTAALNGESESPALFNVNHKFTGLEPAFETVLVEQEIPDFSGCVGE